MRINNATNLLHQRTWVRCFLLIWLAGFNIDFHFEHFFLSLEPLFWSFDLFRVWVCIVFRYLTKTTQNLDAYSMAVSISRPLKPLSNTLALLSSFLTKSVIEGFLLVLPATEVPPIGWQGGLYVIVVDNHMNVYFAQNQALSISAHRLISLLSPRPKLRFTVGTR